MSRGAVFITGASTGIGNATALRLAKAGYDVIPGLRRDEPLPDPVKAPVLIDLADPDSIGPACAEVLSRADGRLVGLINNAGMTISGPFETLGLDQWRHQFEVNFFGHIEITTALLPALIANRGRVVTVGSVGGRMALPFLAPYTSSKFAVRGWMDSLRIEIAPQGVKAILIEPGSVATPLWAKGNTDADAHVAGMTADQIRRYGTQLDGARKAAAMAERLGIPPERCAKVIEHAITSARPKGRYLVGPDAHLQAGVAAMPTRVLDRVTRLAARQPRGR
ncbi:MAG TPA: SDR family oxidoreductase [Mycobacteriales bacterium]|jgi:NAD(P)-dependent dehydrogenase (short-subunit alcohol dehydrogenase family)|nr:SDR family oxidoreductase [Mycobacteriales bacterium]